MAQKVKKDLSKDNGIYKVSFDLIYTTIDKAVRSNPILRDHYKISLDPPKEKLPTPDGHANHAYFMMGNDKNRGGEIYGNSISFRFRGPYDALIQDDKVAELFKEIKKHDRLRGIQ